MEAYRSFIMETYGAMTENNKSNNKYVIDYVCIYRLCINEQVPK
jgi:hypothetical protein